MQVCLGDRSVFLLIAILFSAKGFCASPFESKGLEGVDELKWKCVDLLTEQHIPNIRPQLFYDPTDRSFDVLEAIMNELIARSRLKNAEGKPTDEAKVASGDLYKLVNGLVYPKIYAQLDEDEAAALEVLSKLQMRLIPAFANRIDFNQRTTGYVFTSARNAIIDYKRAQAKYQDVDSLDRLGKEEKFQLQDFKLQASDEILVRDIKAAVGSLPENERRVIQAYFFEGKSLEQIAENGFGQRVDRRYPSQLKTRALEHLAEKLTSYRNPNLTRQGL